MNTVRNIKIRLIALSLIIINNKINMFIEKNRFIFIFMYIIKLIFFLKNLVK